MVNQMMNFPQQSNMQNSFMNMPNMQSQMGSGGSFQMPAMSNMAMQPGGNNPLAGGQLAQHKPLPGMQGGMPSGMQSNSNMGNGGQIQLPNMQNNMMPMRPPMQAMQQPQMGMQTPSMPPMNTDPNMGQVTSPQNNWLAQQQNNMKLNGTPF